jgi:hypothetical protein
MRRGASLAGSGAWRYVPVAEGSMDLTHHMAKKRVTPKQKPGPNAEMLKV